ncbi:hypothetical protein RB195_013025 [Necator americanus]|uniref:Uncharacterized protein n=1 Tax=Necator americanus TaxID=51031 RepID=A0ABR1DUW3_NECAM
MRSEHLKNLPPVLIGTLARFFTHYLSKCSVPKQQKVSKTVLLYKKGDPHEISSYRSWCFLPAIYKLFTTVVTLITLTPVDLRTGRAGASNSSICPDRVSE